ncbi:MAG: hypothetical protein OHK0048_07810 [Rhodoferax sp.]
MSAASDSTSGAPVAPRSVSEPQADLHLPCLLVGLGIMVGGSIYPLMFARMQDGGARADHGLALLLFWAMSAGLVRGVGFVARGRIWRWAFSGTACGVALMLAAAVRFLGEAHLGL